MNERPQAGKRVLVTGACGFIASHLIPRLKARGYDVWEVDIRTGTDCAELTPVELAGCAYVFHLAFDTNIPRSVRSPVFTTEHNVGSSVKLLEAAHQARVEKFLFPSTASLYSMNPTPWREEMPVLPIEPYSIQKYALEKFCGYYDRLGLPTVVLRLFQVFGENQRQDTSLAKFFKARREGKPITLTKTTAQATSRTSRRDFIYAGDVANAFVLAAEADVRNEVINVGSGRKWPMQEIAQAVGGEIEFIPKRDYEVEEHWADITKARKLLGWEPEVDVIAWIKSQDLGRR